MAQNLVTPGSLPQSETLSLRLDTTDFRKNSLEALKLGRQLSSSLVGAFEAVAIKGKSLGDVLKSLALSISDMVLKAAMKPLEQGLGNLFTGLFSGAGVMPFAKGGVISRGLPVPFASGGIIQQPISFPLASGRTGIAGERGAEAIMPLSRGPDGRLGVAVQGGGGGTTINFNVTAADAESFRRSETQLAAMLARAVSAGQRNL